MYESICSWPKLLVYVDNRRQLCKPIARSIFPFTLLSNPQDQAIGIEVRNVMFTIEQINDLHRRLSSANTLPEYVRALKAIDLKPDRSPNALPAFCEH